MSVVQRRRRWTDGKPILIQRLVSAGLRSLFRQVWLFKETQSGLNHFKKSVFLFWLLNMAMRCEHAHRLELRKSFKFWISVATKQMCQKPVLSVIPEFLIILDMHVRN